MTFLIVWAVLLMLFLTVAVYRGMQNKRRVKRIGNRLKSLESKVNDIWQKAK